MLWIQTEAPRGLRGGVFSFASVVAFLAFAGNPAAAAPYADIVVDANSGAVLHQTNPDAKRHPASLTKIMTLYLLFEQLEAGKLKLDSPLKVSQSAAEQSPTKLGLKAGSTIQVEDAIKGIITRSANDAAVVVAEAIAGDEDAFAALMTRKAKTLGMSLTVYKNASGLPDDDQITTARDQSRLGRAIQERFPKYYKYFQTRSFSFRGKSISNHNHLLGRVDGVDGIKTGYIRASGFNLVTSLHRGNRYVVAVVMGGSSAGSRDARMRELIGQTITAASTKQTTTLVAELAGKSKTASADSKPEPKAKAKAESKVAAKAEPKPTAKADAKSDAKDQHRYAIASASSRPVRLAGAPMAHAQRIAPGSSEPIRPVLVRTVTVKAGTLQTAGFTPMHPTLPTAPADPAAPQVAASTSPKVEAPKVETPKVETPKVETPKFEIAKIETPKAETPRVAEIASPQSAMANVSSAHDESQPAAAARAKSVVRTGWMIQVGAFQAEQEAKQRLSAIQTKASKIVDGTDPFTESVEKGGSTLYRARFAGFNKDKAEAACKVLKRDGVECVTIRN
jgi:D-alanyl-D-alanine carboxypeptidase